MGAPLCSVAQFSSCLWDFLVGGILQFPLEMLSSQSMKSLNPPSPHSDFPQVHFTVSPSREWGQVCLPHSKRQWHKNRSQSSISRTCPQASQDGQSLPLADCLRRQDPPSLWGKQDAWDASGWHSISSRALPTCFGFGIMQIFFSFSRPIQTRLIKVNHNYLLSKGSPLKFCPLLTPSHLLPAWGLPRCHLSVP